MASTRKVLRRIPDEKLDWQAHPKSHTIGWNANHLADLPNWLAETLTKTSLDIAPIGAEPFKNSTLTSRQEIVDLFDRNVISGTRCWSRTRTRARCGRSYVKSAIFTMPRAVVEIVIITSSIIVRS